MDLSLSPSDLKFQQEVRDWIAENFDAGLRAKMALTKNGYVDKASQVAWQTKLAGKGWLAPNWPKEHGGTGWTSAWLISNAAATFMAVGKVSLEDWPRLTWSLGWTGCLEPLSPWAVGAFSSSF